MLNVGASLNTVQVIPRHMSLEESQVNWENLSKPTSLLIAVALQIVELPDETRYSSC